MTRKPCRKYDWVEIQKEFVKSGKTAKEFCKDKGINIGSFYQRGLKKDSAQIQKEVQNAIESKKSEIVDKWADAIVSAKEKHNTICNALMAALGQEIVKFQNTDKNDRDIRDLKMLIESANCIYHMQKDILFSFDIDNKNKGLPDMPVKKIETFINEHITIEHEPVKESAQLSV